MVAHAAEKELVALTVGNTSKDGWVSNLVAVEVRDWRTVPSVSGSMNCWSARSLCLAVADLKRLPAGMVAGFSAVAWDRV